MRVVCVLALSLSLWQGQPATVKPTEAAKSSGDPPNSAQGPHDDPWAHTYRAQRAAPEDDDPDSQPTLWLRGQHPEEHGSADAAAGPAAQIPDHTASPTPEGGSSSSGEPDPIHQPGAQPEEDANAHAAAATAAEESTSAGVTPQTEPTAAANTQHSSNATAGPEHIADSDTPTAGAPGSPKHGNARAQPTSPGRTNTATWGLSLPASTMATTRAAPTTVGHRSTPAAATVPAIRRPVATSAP